MAQRPAKRSSQEALIDFERVQAYVQDTINRLKQSLDPNETGGSETHELREEIQKWGDQIQEWEKGLEESEKKTREYKLLLEEGKGEKQKLEMAEKRKREWERDRDFVHAVTQAMRQRQEAVRRQTCF